MQLFLEQVFYGCGSHGYAVLGQSPGISHAARVESLCGAVGTPDANYGGEPFLLSVPEKGRVLMVCGRRGEPDSIRRGTLFFHALVVEKASLVAAKANAFSLFAQGAFAESMTQGIVEAVRIDAKPDKDGSVNHSPDGSAEDAALPCFIRSPHPSSDVVRLLAGRRLNDLAWSTFSFRSMPGFDIQVLSMRVPAPNGTNECDAKGNLLHISTATRPSPRESTSWSNRGEAIGMGGLPAARPVPGRTSSTMLNLSVAANVALALFCVVLCSTRQHTSQDPKPSNSHEPRVVTNEVKMIEVEKVWVTNKVIVQPSPAETNAIGQAAVAEFRKQLAEELSKAIPKEQRIRNFDEEKKSLPKIDDIYKDKRFAQAQSFLKKVECYVTFFNTNTNLQENKDK